MKNTAIGFEKFEETFTANTETMLIKSVPNYNQCKEGRHPLIKLLTVAGAFTDNIVRWCPECGAVVIDWEVDGRTYPGRCMPMKLPHMAKDILNQKEE